MEHIRRRYDPKAVDRPEPSTGMGPHTAGVLEGIQRIQAIGSLVESVLVWRAQYMAANGSAEDAEALLHRMIFREGCENPQAMDLLGRLWFLKGKYADAAGLFRRVAVLQPGNPGAKRALALAERAVKGASVVLLRYRLRFFSALGGCLVLLLGVGWGIDASWRALDRFIEGPGAVSSGRANFRYGDSVANRPFRIDPSGGKEEAFSSTLSFVRRKIGSGAELGRLTVMVDRTGDTVRASGVVPSLYVRYLVEGELRELPGVRNVDLQDLTVERSYRVGRGDSLWFIARRIYGDGRSWPILSEFNTLKSPGSLRVGQVLSIPLGDEELLPLP
jgi:nucleoid-associated protein YgaU